MDLPHRLLYATSARIGGSGLDAVAHESLRAAHRAGVLERAIGFANRQRDVPRAKIRSLRWHPVRLLSWFVGREYYYAAKKHALDRCAAHELARGEFDLFHGWSGECVRTLRECRRRRVPSLIEIPTWHRHKGRGKPARLTMSERERANSRGLAQVRHRLLVTRQQMLEEYDLADLLLVLSQKAEETFLAAGIPREKLFRHHRGVDIERFRPAERLPETFRAVFVGSLIKRKGVHHLLEAWHKLQLKDAKLVLVGTPHPEIEPFIRQFGNPTVCLEGFVERVENAYRSASVHVFPSNCEGSAKSTYEAAACGLPQITTREAGDVVVEGVNGLIVPADDTEALATALARLYRDRELCARFGAAGRRRVVENFTWGHFRKRLLEAYLAAAHR